MSLVYIHLNRLIKKYDLDVIFLAGPGHGAPASDLECLSGRRVLGDLSRQDFRRRRRPAAVCSSSSPSPAGSAAIARRRRPVRFMKAENWAIRCRTPMAQRSIIPIYRHGHGRRRRSRDRAARDGVALNKFLNPVRDGAVLPVLHLNGYKITNPTILSRISHEELELLFHGYGYDPYFVEGSDPETMHQAMAATLEHCVQEIRRIQQEARADASGPRRPRWPMIILRSPKGGPVRRRSTDTKSKGSGARTRCRSPRCTRSPRI